MIRLQPWTSFARWTTLGLLVLLSSAPRAHAQDLVPGAYIPAPGGINIVTVATMFSKGNVNFDPALPIDDAHATMGGALMGVRRTLNMAGRSGNISLAVPLLFGHVEGLVLDQFQEATRRGLGDLTARIAINLYGAPGMTLQQFATYRATTIVGVSLGVAAPVGQYSSSRYINLGTNRWAFKPEIGIAHTRGRWTFEADIGAGFFTDNTDFVNQGTRQQAPILALQGHLIHTIRPGLWIAADGNYWQGGRVTTNGTRATVEQKDSRLGATLAVPIGRQQVRFSYSLGAYTTLGGDFHSVGMSYSYAWVGRP